MSRRRREGAPQEPAAGKGEEPRAGRGERSPVSLGLEVTALLGSSSTLDDAVARIDGVLNLATKAVTAIQRGGPGDRDKALSLVGRAERFVPDEGDLPPERREDVRLMRVALADLRVRAEAMPQ